MLQVVGRDGDTLFLQHEAAHSIAPAEWPDALAAMLARWPRTAVVGAKRVRPTGEIASCGEFVVHPKGFHHLGRGATGNAYRFPIEVDAITGGVLAIRQSAIDDSQSAVERLSSPLGAIDLCLALRQRDWRVAVDPSVVVVEETTAEPEMNVDAHRAFIDRWGFDWRAADLSAVRARYAGTGLLWNIAVHGRALPFAKYAERPLVHWRNYEEVSPYRQRAEHLVQLVQQLLPAGRVLDLGCGDGLFTHLFARLGLEAIGMDPEQIAIDQAQQRTAGESYPAAPPSYVCTEGQGDVLPLPDRSVHLVTLLDVIEHLENPVGLLREVKRIMKPGGGVLISTPEWQFGGSSDPVYHGFEYTEEELVRQVEACGFECMHTGRIGGTYRDLIVIGRRA